MTFLRNRIREKLWVRPMIMALVSIGGAFAARAADLSGVGDYVPDISIESITTLLSVLSSSMLVIATFAVASMVSAYASASTTATPRSFALIIADDGSQNALSSFIGAFIFSVVSLVALQNSFYDTGARFALFVLTVLVFAIVILTFVRWVDAVARLGRLDTTINKVEAATDAALRTRIEAPWLGGIRATGERSEQAHPVISAAIGYVQRVEVEALQKLAEQGNWQIELAALPGTFASPGRVLAWVTCEHDSDAEVDVEGVAKAFRIGGQRTFDEDPRFGLVVLSEIASRALSPGINDAGTAIDVVGTLVRLFALWGNPDNAERIREPEFDRVAVPALELNDMFDDAFTTIARDGAGSVEVIVRLQKAFTSLADLGNEQMRETAIAHARRTVARADQAMNLDADKEAVRRVLAE